MKILITLGIIIGILIILYLAVTVFVYFSSISIIVKEWLDLKKQIKKDDEDWDF